jgi:hypothetical protein
MAYSLERSQSFDPLLAANSFWFSSYIHASDGHDYLIVSHALHLPTSPGYVRASLLDITEPALYLQAVRVTNASEVSSATNVFNISYADWSFGSPTVGDNISTLRGWSNLPSVRFDITFETSAPPLLNGGVGSFEWGNGTIFEWSMPAGRTSGEIVVHNNSVAIDSARSITWYDRQWGGIAPTNWTWFALYLNEDDGDKDSGATVLSMWIWDDQQSGHRQFATIRRQPGVHEVVPVTDFTPSTTRFYYSNATGILYPLEWSLSLLDGTQLSISSIRPDQEIVGPNRPSSAYEGFVTVKSPVEGSKVKGYGMVEMVHNI